MVGNTPITSVSQTKFSSENLTSLDQQRAECFCIPLFRSRNHSLSVTTCAFQAVYVSWVHELKKLLLFKLGLYYSVHSVDIY